MTLFVKGMLIGILIAMPVGPSGAIAVRRTLTRGSRTGFVSGIGASMADAVYLAILQFGPARSLFFFEPGLIRGAGAVVTVYIGTRLLVVNPLPVRTDRVELDDKSAFFSSFLLSIANPAILISLAVLLNAFGLVNDNHSPAVLISAVFCGSALLWLLLTRWLAHRMLVGVIRKITGMIFISLGVAILLGLLSQSIR